jgi:hypothetical protein
MQANINANEIRRGWRAWRVSKVGDVIYSVAAIILRLIGAIWPLGGMHPQAGELLHPPLLIGPLPIGPLPIGPLPLTVAEEPVDEVPAQALAGGEPIKVYPDVKGINKSRRKKALKRLNDFHEHIKEVLWKIEDNNTLYGVHIQETHVGKGLFNGEKHIPIGTRLFVYIARLVTREQNKRDGSDLSYVFPYGPFMEYECFADTKITVRDLNPINAGCLNHSCLSFNCRANWVLVKWGENSEYYMEVYNIKQIQPKERFTISYNDISPEDKIELEKSLYMVPMTSLSHLPAGRQSSVSVGPMECAH